MKKSLPHLTCFMMSSVDGRIDSDRFGIGSPASMFETLAAKIPSDGWIVGRVTAAEISDAKPYRPRRGRFEVPKGDFVAPHQGKTFAIAIDPEGRVNWQSPEVEGDHVIAVLTEKVPADYLAHLREKKISYIFGGKTSFNLSSVLQKLGRLFPIKRLTVQGGGKVNGAFLKAGLISEIQLLLAPAADGSKKVPTTFDTEQRKGTRLTLLSAEVMKKDFVLLKYRVKP